MRCPSGLEVGKELMEMKYDFLAIRKACQKNKIVIFIRVICSRSTHIPCRLACRNLSSIPLFSSKVPLLLPELLPHEY